MPFLSNGYVTDNQGNFIARFHRASADDRRFSLGNTKLVFGGDFVDDEVFVQRTAEGHVTWTGDLGFGGATAGLHLNRIGTTQRDALTPAPGMVIHNDDDDDIQAYSNGSWRSLTQPGVAVVLNDMGDVSISTPAAAQVLRYSGSAWVNAALAAEDIASGTFADALVAASNVTQHQAALSITESQVSDLGSYQTQDAELTALAGLVSAADKLPYFTGSGSASLADFTAAGRALVDDANAAAQRTTLGLAIGSNVQSWSNNLDDIAALAPTKGNILAGNGADWLALAVGLTDGHVLTVDSAEAAGVKWAAAGGGASISAGDSDMTVIDAGAGHIAATVDATEQGRWFDNGLKVFNASEGGNKGLVFGADSSEPAGSTVTLSYRAASADLRVYAGATLLYYLNPTFGFSPGANDAYDLGDHRAGFGGWRELYMADGGGLWADDHMAIDLNDPGDVASGRVAGLYGPTRGSGSTNGQSSWLALFSDVEDGQEEVGRISWIATDVATGTVDSGIKLSARRADTLTDMVTFDIPANNRSRTDFHTTQAYTYVNSKLMLAFQTGSDDAAFIGNFTGSNDAVHFGGSTTNLSIRHNSNGGAGQMITLPSMSTAPTSTPVNAVALYGVDVASSSELQVRDEAGNVTTLSPHNFSMIPDGRSEEMAWGYYSERDGQYVNVDMLLAMRVLEQLSGKKLVHTGRLTA